MNLEQYSALAMRTVNELGPQGNLVHAALGISDEAGEVAGAVKKHVAYGKDLNVVNVVEELGDLAWFMTLMMRTIDVTWDQVLAANIAKLEARYPSNQFSEASATNRDAKAEYMALSSNL